MKLTFAIVIFIFSVNIYSEVVSVPSYNYWIYPPVGWVLQEYKDDSTLSWFSSDKKIAFTINAWKGDMYDSLDEMFETIASSINGDGEFIPFDFYGRDAIIGDTSFTFNSESHRGWFVFIEGDDYDYYFYSYSFDYDYEFSLPQILSVLDSFGIGESGKTSSGPITVFYDSLSKKDKESYEFDFFGYPILVELERSIIESSNNVIEREAKIMESYAHSPDLFYEAWIRYYQILYRDNYNRIEPFYNAISPYIDRSKYDDYSLTELLMFWIQGFKYERREDKSSDLISPVESIANGIGDCDSKSLVLTLLLSRYNIDSIILTSEKVKHAITGVKCAGEGVTFEYNGDIYLGIELTSQNLIGEIKEGFENPSLWTFVDLEYDSGL